MCTGAEAAVVGAVISASTAIATQPDTPAAADPEKERLDAEAKAAQAANAAIASDRRRRQATLLGLGATQQVDALGNPLGAKPAQGRSLLASGDPASRGTSTSYSGSALGGS
jgi:hypothetical protein